MVLVWFLSFYGIRLQAQESCNNHLEITVIDKFTNQALPFASVIVSGTKIKGTTDGHGHFSLEKLCSTTIEIQIFHLACEAKSFTIALNTGNLDTTLFMDHKSIDLEVVDINHKHNGENFAGHSNVISTDQLNNTFGDGLNGISKKLPSLSFSSGGIGTEKPMINGLGGSRIGVIYNQTALKYQQWGGEHASSVSFFAGDNIEVIDELGALKYGSEAFGGAVMIKDASIFDQKTPFNISVLSQFKSNPLGGKINVKSSGHLHKLGEVFYKVGFEQSAYGAANTPTGYVSNTARNSNNYFAHIGKKIRSYALELSYMHSSSNQGIYQGSHISNVTDLRNAIVNSDNRIKDNTGFEIASPKISETHELLQFSVKRAINKGELSLEASQQINLRKEFDSHRKSTPSTQLSLANKNIALHGKWFAKNTLFSVGANVQKETNVYNYSRVIPDYDMLNAGVYAGAKHYFKTSYITAGFRVEWYDITPTIGLEKYAAIDSVDFSDLAASGILAYHFSKGKLQHQVQVSHNFRFPNAFELYAFGIHHGSAEYVEGSTALETESATGFSYRLKYQSKLWQLEINPYYRLYNNYILNQPTGETVLTISGAFPKMAVSNQDLNMLGLNINLFYQAHQNVELRLTANRIYSFIPNSKNSIYGIDPGRSNLFATYKISNHFSAEYSLEYNYGAGGGAGYMIDNMVVENSTATLLHNSELSCSKFEDKGLKLKLGIQNIFNTEYYRYTNSSRIFYPELGRNIFLSILYYPKHKQHEH
jgi:iron complex outermembrane receptor protein